MGTAIEWTDQTWNPVTGCTKVSPGCKFCYAERVAKRYWGARKFTNVQVHADRLDQPLRWRRPRRIFVNSMSDLFHKAVSDEFLDQVFAVMAHSHVRRLLAAHTFQVLTKRPERMLRYLSDPETSYRVGSTVAKIYVGFYPMRGACDWRAWTPWPLPNVHLGVSVEDQARTSRIEWLLQTPAAVRFLSIEPLLGLVDLAPWLSPCSYYCDHEQPYPADHHPERPRLDWVIVGGESGGPSERALVEATGLALGTAPKPEALTWVRSLRDQCVAAGVPFFFKQWGGITPKAGGRILDGRTWDEWPSSSEANRER